MDTPATSAPPLNAFQRRYFAWAEPWYQRMDPQQREEARRIDMFLYSRRGAVFWLSLLAALLGSAALLVHLGDFPWPLAIMCSMGVWIALPLAALGVWLKPEKYSDRQLLRASLLIVLGVFTGALAGFLTGRIAKLGLSRPQDILASLGDAFWRAAPVLLIAAVGLVVFMAVVVRLRRWQMGRELDRLRMQQALDTAARHAAEARLATLRAQVQPHFIFNTLAALQHWVDEGDPRAASLLRSLTGFLRGSTELLARERTTLGEELPLVEHYLAVMRARWGERLSSQVRAEPVALSRSMPPGILLTLVENAVEHGAGARLSGGEVQVTVHCDAAHCVIEVADNGPGPASDWREGVGLANARERLVHHFGARARLQLLARPEGGGLARVELPMEEGATPSPPPPPVIAAAAPGFLK